MPAFRKTLLTTTLTSVLVVSLFSTVKAGAATPAFSDLGDSYAKAEIEALAAQNVIGGYGDHSFRPTNTMTRDEFAAMLARTLQLKPAPEASAEFTDVEGWARPYVGALVKKGITSGISETRFGGQDPITREQLSVFFLRAMGAEQGTQNLELTSTFDDAAQISKYAKPFVALTQQIDFTQGQSEANGLFFKPQDNAERQAVARLCYEFFTHLETYGNKIYNIATNAMILDNSILAMDNLKSAKIQAVTQRTRNDKVTETIDWTADPFSAHVYGTAAGVDADGQTVTHPVEAYAENGNVYSKRETRWANYQYIGDRPTEFASVVPFRLLRASMAHDLAPYLTLQEDESTYTLTGSVPGRDYQLLFLRDEDRIHPDPSPMTYKIVIQKGTLYQTSLRAEQPEPFGQFDDYTFSDFNQFQPTHIPSDVHH